MTSFDSFDNGFGFWMCLISNPQKIKQKEG